MSFIIALILQWIAWMANTIRKKNWLMVRNKNESCKECCEWKKTLLADHTKEWLSNIWVKNMSWNYYRIDFPQKKERDRHIHGIKDKICEKINQHNEHVMSLIPFKSDSHHISC